MVVKSAERDDLVVATLFNNLAVVHKYQGRFAEASRLYRRALPMLQNCSAPIIPKSHPSITTWADWSTPAGATPRVSRSPGVRWLFAKRRWGRTIPTSPLTWLP